MTKQTQAISRFCHVAATPMAAIALLSGCGPNWPQEHREALAAVSGRLAEGDAAGAVEQAEWAIEIGRTHLSAQPQYLCDALLLAADATERADDLPASISHLKGVLESCDALSVKDRFEIDVRLLDLLDRAELDDDYIEYLAGVVLTDEYQAIAGTQRMSELACELGFLHAIRGTDEAAVGAFGLAVSMSGGGVSDFCDEAMIVALMRLQSELLLRDAFTRLFAIAATQPAMLGRLVLVEPDLVMRGAEALYEAGETSTVLDAWRSLVGTGGRLPPDSSAAAMVAGEVFRVLVQQDPPSQDVVGVWRWMPAPLLSTVARSAARPHLFRAWQVSTDDASAVAAYATALHGAFRDGSVVFRANALDNPFFWQIAMADALARLGRHRDAVRSLGNVDEDLILSWDPAQQDFDRWLGLVPGILEMCMDKVECGEIHAAGKRLVAATMAVLDRRSMQPAGTMPARVAELTALVPIAVKIGDIPSGMRILERIMELRRAAGATDADLLHLRRRHAAFRFDQVLADTSFDVTNTGQLSMADQMAFTIRVTTATQEMGSASMGMIDGASEVELALQAFAMADVGSRLQRAMLQERWRDAYAAQVEFGQVVKRLYGTGGVLEWQHMVQQADLAHKIGRRDEAARLFREGNDMIRGTLGPYSMTLALGLGREADMREDAGRRREADELRALARAIQACRRSSR
jgi:hypothetical protein